MKTYFTNQIGQLEQLNDLRESIPKPMGGLPAHVIDTGKGPITLVLSPDQVLRIPVVAGRRRWIPQLCRPTMLFTQREIVDRFLPKRELNFNDIVHSEFVHWSIE